ncbi:hypothetical protein I4U23_023399 [Adineta vaga]|nr:hypothetical protein I4U23_023399 [Adineta vaga]
MNLGTRIWNFNDPDATIISTDIMLCLANKQPDILPEPQWWPTSHLREKSECCALRIHLCTLKTQNVNEDEYNRIFN